MSYIDELTRAEAVRIQSFRVALTRTEARYKGVNMLARSFAKYLQGPTIPGPEAGLNWFWYLPKYLDDAFTAFRLDTAWADLRDAYRAETYDDIPSFTDVHIGGFHRLLVIPDLVRVVVEAAGDRADEANIMLAVHAQQACIDAAWRKFVRVAYSPMLKRINTNNRGTFGQTTLTTGATGGRVAFQFTRDGGRADMTYIAADNDPVGYRSGSNVTATPYAVCVAMIEEVAALWQVDKMKAIGGG